ncbi:MAG TPA: DUF3352 domain-containing protein [Candidatus Limnocylindrales bacterium]
MTARTRWLIGGGVAVVAIVVVAGAALLLGARPVPEALRYVPANSAVVAELRLDLPGDQFQKVGNLLSHFPGFADQSTLGAKLDEALDRLTGDATSGAVQYTTKLKPWLAGPTFVGISAKAGGAGPSASAGPAPSGAAGLGSAFGGDADGVVVATTDGTATCESVIAAGTRQSIPQGSLLVDSSGTMACFLDGKFGLLGTPDAVQAALEAHAGGTGMDHDATYAKARDTLGGDRIATVYVSGAAAQLMTQAEASLAPSLAPSLSTNLAAAVVPEWLIAGIRAEDDALVTDILAAPPKPGSGPATGSPAATLPTLPPAHASDIAGFLPADTVLLAEAHGVGVLAQGGLAALGSDPDFQSQASQLDAALSLAGGPQGVVGWISDAGVVVVPSANAAAGGSGASAGGTGLDIGLVLVASDDATATAKVAQLKNLLSLAALSGGGSVNDQSVDGTTVTTIDLGDLSSLLGQAGASGQLQGLPIPTDLRLTFTIAVRGKLVLIGGDDAFARDLLGVDAGSTLADQAAYKRSFSHAAAANLGQVYVAGDSLRQLVGKIVPAAEQSTWQEVAPYAAPIDAVLLTTTVENGISHTKLVITVSTPPAAPAAT